MMKVELHAHTEYSHDSFLSLSTMIRVCRDKGINCLAVTDHNTIKGAVQLQKIAPFTVIVGEEIGTAEGEIIGYFLAEEIPPGLSPEETIGRIKRQGGLVAVPHPFDRLRRSAIRPETLKRIINLIDIVEVFNSRNVYQEDNQKALHFSNQHKKIMIAGSDCHTRFEVGNSHIVMQDFSDVNDFKEKLAKADLFCRKSSLAVHMATKFIKLIR